VAIAELIGKLFKTHKELTLPLVHVLYTQVLSNVLQPNLSDKMHKFGIFLIGDMIEHLGIELIPDIWPALSEALLAFATDKSPIVRRPALYGIGVLAEKSKEAFAAMSEVCIKKVVDGINVPNVPEVPQKVYGGTKDNGVSALGKIIKNHADKIPNIEEIVQYWINCLPLKYDKEEAQTQHQMLVDIIMYGNASLWAGPNFQNLPQIVKVFVDIINTKLVTVETNKAIVSVLKLLLSDEKSKSIVENAVAAMTDEKKKKIQQALSSMN